MYIQLTLESMDLYSNIPQSGAVHMCQMEHIWMKSGWEG